jgi:nitrogenase molybdenum-iron protein alpha/beta subunit
MTTKQIIQEMEKELAKDKWSAECIGSVSDYIEGIDEIVKPHLRKLIQAVSEEIIGEDEDEALDDFELKERWSKNLLRAEQRLKVKEILEVIK